MAKKSSLPTQWEKFDLMDFERQALKMENAKIKAAAAQAFLQTVAAEFDTFQKAMLVKYKMTKEDKLATDTGKIERAK